MNKITLKLILKGKGIRMSETVHKIKNNNNNKKVGRISLPDFKPHYITRVRGQEWTFKS